MKKLDRKHIRPQVLDARALAGVLGGTESTSETDSTDARMSPHRRVQPVEA